MVCIKNLEVVIIGNEMTLFECEELIREVSDEVYLVPGGYNLLGVLLKGARPFPVGFKDDSLFFQYVKPCFGIFALQMEKCENINELKTDFRKQGFEQIK
ncbi:MAG: DUF1894 domain-containing protein [Methanimicrococcus sp.]|nr:DUF1894 domain-containing protein [Methanimicrococcus sp.]